MTEIVESIEGISDEIQFGGIVEQSALEKVAQYLRKEMNVDIDIVRNEYEMIKHIQILTDDTDDVDMDVLYEVSQKDGLKVSKNSVKLFSIEKDIVIIKSV